MNRLITAVAALLVAASFAGPSTARAVEHVNGSLGFHNLEAPVGIRWWLSGQKVGVDVGLGFVSVPAPSYSDEKLTSWAVDVGVPLVLRSWDRVHVIVRPGMLYTSQQLEATSPPTAFDTADLTSFLLSGEVEAEVFLVDNFSVSASHGIAFISINLD